MSASEQTSRMNTLLDSLVSERHGLTGAPVFFFLPIWAAPEEAKTEALSQCSSFQTNSKSAWAKCHSLLPPRFSLARILPFHLSGSRPCELYSAKWEERECGGPGGVEERPSEQTRHVGTKEMTKCERRSLPG